MFSRQGVRVFYIKLERTRVGRLRNGRLIFSLHRTSNCFRPSMSSLFLSLSVALSTPGVLPLASCFSTHSPAGKLFFSLCSLAPLFASSLSSLSFSLSVFPSFSRFALLLPLSCSSLSFSLSPLLPLPFLLLSRTLSSLLRARKIGQTPVLQPAGNTYASWQCAR